MSEAAKKHTTKGKPPVADEDYYFENGLLVMTARFHLRRGYCCGNLCRHCPFEYARVPASKRKTVAVTTDGETSARSRVSE